MKHIVFIRVTVKIISPPIPCSDLGIHERRDWDPQKVHDETWRTSEING
jgi:hypothetical protein